MLWVATVLSNIGTWMLSTASAWLMTGLSPSPLMVSAVQAASTAPMFLFAVLAGALSDLFDRRRLLLVVQALAACGAAALAVLAAGGLVGPAALLGFTFFMATTAAFVAPAWQAIVPRLVPRPLLGQAVALNSVGINVARAIGPALAGLLIVKVGIAAPFAADAASYLFIIAALLWWRMPVPVGPSAAPGGREHVASAIVGGLRFAANSPDLKAALLRALGFFLFASAPMSLLPLVARTRLGGDASTFGLLMGAMGAGAVAGALVLPRLKGLGAGRRVFAGTLLTASAGAILAVADRPEQGIAASALFGIGWIWVLATLNTAAQMSLPDWVRARGLAIYTMVFSGAMTAGSLGWGALAELAGSSTALAAAAAGGVGIGLLLVRRPLADGGPDHTPSAHWPQPLVAVAPDADRGPVLVTVRYAIDPTDVAPMLSALHALGLARRRGGAIAWACYQDAAAPGQILEQFIEPSWAHHLRHHERISAADFAAQQAVQAFHRADAPPQVTHWLSAAG